eukprot:NODE_9889_length_621_cov_15.056225_g9621_i0.p1 GENE.NODE_9889_length_621_cov_15.056225_g9621_i0~~NODE_9889_length_621_cov_15.056225_g9621_i0.p1  ORF type:complete len:158 (+),score=35.43 NODE_9889_length_621_cov_15.056225_g9621_i0:57-476(+)
MPGFGGWAQVVPTVGLMYVVWYALTKTYLQILPPNFTKRFASDSEFNRLLHLRFNKALQDKDSVAGQAVKEGARPEFAPFDTPSNVFSSTYRWNEEVLPHGHSFWSGNRATYESTFETWYQSHFTRRVCDDSTHNGLPF